MSVHFEAKKNLYFVLFVYKIVNIFVGDGMGNGVKINFIMHITFLIV